MKYTLIKHNVDKKKIIEINQRFWMVMSFLSGEICSDIYLREICYSVSKLNVSISALVNL